MMTADLSDRLADALERIIDDPLVVKLLLARDPQAWADAVNVLAEAEGMDATFDRMQAGYDAAEPDDDEQVIETPDDVLHHLVIALDVEGEIDGSQHIHRLSDRQATVGIWIDGHEYSLTLNRED